MNDKELYLSGEKGSGANNDLAGRRLAVECARLLDESKMEDIRVFHVGASLHVTDYFIVATGRNARHLKAAGDRVFKAVREQGVQRYGVEGYRDGKWVLIDLVDVVVHLFEAEHRKFYDLELLWGDCPRIDWEAEAVTGGNVSTGEVSDGASLDHKASTGS